MPSESASPAKVRSSASYIDVDPAAGGGAAAHLAAALSTARRFALPRPASRERPARCRTTGTARRSTGSADGASVAALAARASFRATQRRASRAPLPRRADPARGHPGPATEGETRSPPRPTRCDTGSRLGCWKVPRARHECLQQVGKGQGESLTDASALPTLLRVVPPSLSDARVTAERVKLLFQFSPESYLIAVLVGGGTAFLLWSDVARVTLLAWIAWILLVSGSRYALYIAYRRRNPPAQAAWRWERYFTAGSTLMSLGWAALPALLFPERHRVSVRSDIHRRSHCDVGGGHARPQLARLLAVCRTDGARDAGAPFPARRSRVHRHRRGRALLHRAARADLVANFTRR